MYKPTTYLTVELDPAHASTEGATMMQRVFGFIDPLTCVPADELGLSLRLKAGKHLYWDATDEEQEELWNTIVGPFMKAKTDIILNVLEECNNPKYQHYEGNLDVPWLTLDMAPHTIRFRLPITGENTDMPPVYELLGRVRELLGALELADAEAFTVHIPARVVVEALSAQTAAALADEEAGAIADAAEAVAADAESEAAEVAGIDAETKAAEAVADITPIAYDTIEFVAKDGTATTFDLSEDRWL